MNTTGTKTYIVFDEMAMEEKLRTTDLSKAKDEAYNYQCILANEDGSLIHDYSCDY